MSSKITTTGVALVVIGLLVAPTPAAAQAEPHYYRNNVLIGSEPVPVVEWGTLTWKVRGGSGVFTCRNVIGGSVENPEGGGAGTGATESFTAYGCELNECPTELGLHAAFIAESIPWSNVLILEGSTLRQRSTGVKVDMECLSGETLVGGQKDVGSNQPKAIKGTSALHPGVLEFNVGSNELEGEGSKGAVQENVEGKLKVLGYEEQEVINAKTT